MARPGSNDRARHGAGPLHAAGVQQLALPKRDLPRRTGSSLEGEVVRVTYENESTGFRVLRVAVEGRAEPEVVVGVVPSATAGARVRVTGKWERDGKFGDQFKAETLLVVQPETLAGLEKYLASGAVPGVGPTYAKRIVAKFRDKTMEVLDHQPERLRDVPGLGAKRADAVARAWSSQRAVSAIMIFLQAHGASPALATRIHRRFGDRAMDIVSRNPYRLALDVWGIGFKTADRLARSLGVAADAPERAQAGVLHVLVEISSRGHVFAPRQELASIAGEMLEREPAEADRAIDALVDAGRVRVDPGAADGDAAVYATGLHEAEVRVARRLAALASPERAAPIPGAAEAIAAFEKRAGVTLAPAQRDAVEQAARHRLLVVTGGPGVGKTTIVRALLSVFDAAKLPVRLAAPTGRAAKRMSEATSRDAVTLHRLLEYDPKQRAFQRRHSDPIDARALVVDETSMLDLELADALLDAVPDRARLVLVGDVDQLPSVGPGAVLRDAIASGVVPTVRLTQIFRQAAGSLIVTNAHRIHEGEPPESAAGPDGEFYVVPRTSAEAAAEAIHELVTQRIPARFGLDPVRDVQVLTPMHRGAAGAIALNQALQAALNPTGPAVVRGDRTLRAGDKVMQLRNDYNKEVYNGDVGLVARVDPEAREVVVRYDEREVEYAETELDELALAYATTIHKSQGSEYPAVVIPLLTQHFVMLSRNLVYTAVTRGKRLVVLVADPRAVGLALAETRKEDRRTRLGERLRDAAEPLKS